MYCGKTRLILSIFFIIVIAACDIQPKPKQTHATGINQPNPSRESVLIKCQTQCAEIADLIRREGGHISQRYHNINLLAATVSQDQLTALAAIIDKNSIVKDITIKSPSPIEKQALQHSTQAKTTTLPYQSITANSSKKPNNYSFNNRLTGAQTLHEQGQQGADVIVVVIDSGTANNKETVPVLADSVIGGESFVEGDEEPSATSTLNDDHGTWVATMIAAHGVIELPNDSEVAQAVRSYALDSIETIDSEVSQIPMVAPAPAAKIYALKTFPADGSGAPSSRVIAAMDRVLTLKKNFNKGIATTPIAGDGSEDNPFVYDALDIKVVNMSLGGVTLFATQDVEDILTEQMLAEDIVVVVSAGNEGFGAMTIGSPATGLGALTVGAANSPIHERVLRELQSGVGEGIKFRPSQDILMASFSSRGPTPDGRVGIDIVANGMASFVQGADGSVALVSGTSFSAPSVAGAAALLIGAVPNASARQIKAALIKSANGNLIANANPIDQGNGFLDIPAALNWLTANTSQTADDDADDDDETNSLNKKQFSARHEEEDDDDDDGVGNTKLISNKNQKIATILEKSGFSVVEFEDDEIIVDQLQVMPGQVKQFFVPSDANTQSILVNINNIQAQLPPEQQNVIFGDDLFVTIIDAPTSIDKTHLRDFFSEDVSVEILHPQEGILRIAVMGDWTNIGAVSADISFARKTIPLALPIANSRLQDKQLHHYSLTIDAAMTLVQFSLYWQQNWAYFPTHDLDLVLVDPNGEVLLDGATLASPEIINIENPIVGEWTLIVDGFQLHDMQDQYELRSIDQNGAPINITLQ